MKHFDAQNPVIGSLIWRVDISRKKDRSKFLDKAPDIRDLEFRSRLNKLCNGRNFLTLFNGLFRGCSQMKAGEGGKKAPPP